MNVWLVTEGSDHEGAAVHGIFSTREKAEAYKNTMPPNLFIWQGKTSDMNRIIEATLDVPERGGWSI